MLDEGASEWRLMLPAAVQGSYELEIEFTHSPADGVVSLIVPVGLRRVRVTPTARAISIPSRGRSTGQTDKRRQRRELAGGNP